MILVVALNPALDVTHHVPGVDWSGVNRPHQVRARPGGKGLNVARTLQALDSDTAVIGLAGGVTGDAVRAGLTEAGVPARFVSVAGETRRTFAVVDTARHETALFNEPGPRISAGEWAALIVMYEKSLAGSSAVVLSGSLPRGLAADSYAGLAARAAEAGVPAVLDAEGPALLHGAAGGPAIVKPNLAELERTVGRSLSGPDLAATAAAARELRAAGAARSGPDRDRPTVRSSSARFGLTIAGPPAAPRSSAGPSASSTAGTPASAARAARPA